MQSAIKLWLAREVPRLDSFADVVQRYYRGELQVVNFNDVGGTTRTVNDWVSRITHGKINSIVDQSKEHNSSNVQTQSANSIIIYHCTVVFVDSLAPDTRMLLTTAVYFKGTWRNSFDKTATRSRCFNVPNFDCQNVPLMESDGIYKYAEVPALDAQVIQIPYAVSKILF